MLERKSEREKKSCLKKTLPLFLARASSGALGSSRAPAFRALPPSSPPPSRLFSSTRLSLLLARKNEMEESTFEPTTTSSPFAAIDDETSFFAPDTNAAKKAVASAPTLPPSPLSSRRVNKTSSTLRSKH